MGPALKIDLGAQHFAVKWSRKMKRFTPVMLTNGRKTAIYNLIIRHSYAIVVVKKTFRYSNVFFYNRTTVYAAMPQFGTLL